MIEEVTAHAQSDSLEDAREICADGTYFPNNLRIYLKVRMDPSMYRATAYLKTYKKQFIIVNFRLNYI